MRNAKLAKEILQMAKFDQKVRKAYIKNLTVYNGKKLQAIDIENLEKMKRIVKEFDWPTFSLVGKKASHQAWLLVQHADSDVKFQEYCLELMKKAARRNGVSKTDTAYLTDRILVNKGKSQIYGTQFHRDRMGKLVPRPIRDIRRLNQKRRDVGLEHFETYQQKIEIGPYFMNTRTINIYILKGSGRLASFMKIIEETSRQAVGKIVEKIPISDIDIVIYDNPDGAIPEIGIGGLASNAHTILISLDPNFKHFNKTINEEIERTLAHELHHCLRWRSVEYGKTLLEALVSEGLADHFDTEVTNKGPQPWDTALTAKQVSALWEKAKREYRKANYNHHDWFFGSKRRGIPRWTGYTLGYLLIDKYLKNNPGKRPSKLYTVKAKVFL